MPIPDFTTNGDLPLGVHQATLPEVVAHFGATTSQRQTIALRLERVYNIARGTGALARFVIFGSFITDKPEPNDIDVFMVMEDYFKPTLLTGESVDLFDHFKANREFGGSIFWTKRGGIIGDEQAAIEDWQIKKDRSYRGIVEVIPEAP